MLAPAAAQSFGYIPTLDRGNRCIKQRVKPLKCTTDKLYNLPRNWKGVVKNVQQSPVALRRSLQAPALRDVFKCVLE